MSQRPALLCVDDERIVLRGLKDQLRRHFSARLLIETAESGVEALEVYDELQGAGHVIPVVVSDQMMPGMTGDQLLATLHARDPRIRSVMLTGQATGEAVGNAVNRAGLFRFLAKPWVEADLAQTVREALRSWELAREVERHQEEVRASNVASQRFVPAEFLRLLGRQRVVEVQQGDHAEGDLAVLSLAPTGFRSRAEGLSPAAAFQLVNDTLQRLDRAVREAGGFVGAIDGTTVLCLFPGGVDQAVQAAVAAHAALRATETGLALAAGLDAGPLLLGTVGGDERLQCDMVGEPVQVAEQLRELGPRYEAGLLLTGRAAARLARPGAVTQREVDRLRIAGRVETTGLVEVLDALPPDRAQARADAAAAFQQARALFAERRFTEAQRAFRQVLARDRRDGAAWLYMERCQRLAGQPPSPSWDGARELSLG